MDKKMRFSNLHSGIPFRKTVGKESEKIHIVSQFEPKEKQDVFYADVAKFLERMWSDISLPLKKESSNIVLTAKKASILHKMLYNRYPALIQKFEEEYIRNLVQNVQSKQHFLQNSGDTEAMLSQNEKLYSRMIANNDFSRHLIQPSAVDGVKIFIYVAELIYHKSNNLEEFKRIFFSKGTTTFLKHLASNTKIATKTFEKHTSLNPREKTLSASFHFNPELFTIKDDVISVDAELMAKIREKIIKENERLGDQKINDVRFCPALFAGNTFDEILDWSRTEICRHYEANQNGIFDV